MIISWDWLRALAPVELSVDELTARLMMAGLNHESTQAVGDDLAIDLEVTSNRPDCLGHLGVAREAAVLCDVPLQIPAASPAETASPAGDWASLSLEAPELCPRYTARIVRGARVGPSPAWLVRRLETIGVEAINSVVDVTNYVLMECGQPLHAFDLGRLQGPRIVVRHARAGETLEAINHRAYPLDPSMCVIADAARPVAIAGVMGGAATEVTTATRDILLEAAIFTPASVRATSRTLGLHSPSSYRFERGLDPEGVDWASRRACALILEIAGGELAAGALVAGPPTVTRQPVTLRFAQLQRILGIEIPAARAREILTALGAQELEHRPEQVTVRTPSWRRDLSREIDLVEEVARIHGYEAIPEDVSVPMTHSARTPEDRLLGEVRQTLVAHGFFEAYTASLVEEDWSEAFSPWTTAQPLVSQTPLLRRADRLRRSLAPSLLGARRTNESQGNADAELFEIARAYLPRPGELPDEVRLLGIVSGGDFFDVKGVLEGLLETLHAPVELEVRPASLPLIEPGTGAELLLQGERWGWLGTLSDEGRRRFDLRGRTTLAEVRVAALLARACVVPRYHRLPSVPAIERDLNLVVAEQVTWAELLAAVRAGGGARLEATRYRDTYRNPEQLGQGRKSILLSLVIRDPATTLTSGEADAVRDEILVRCRAACGAELRA